MMFSHYLTTALRHFRRHKLTTAINVICLAVGLLCFLAVCGIVMYLHGNDMHFPDSERIVAITQKTQIPGTASNIPEGPVIAFSAAKYLKSDFPELEAVAREGSSIEVPVAAGDRKSFVHARYADPELFDIFPVQLIVGDRTRALRQPGSVVLSEATAVQLFDSADRALGREILLYGGRAVTVTGVLGAIPQPSHFSVDPSANVQRRVDMFITMDIWENSENGKVMAANWNSPTVSTFALMPRNGSLSMQAFRERLQSFGARHVPKGDWICEFSAIPISYSQIITLDSIVGADKTGISSISLLYILGALVLLVSCLNYANLASAQATTRAKEIGMRRVVGARRYQLIVQYLFEAGLLVLVAVMCSVIVLLMGLAVVRSEVSDFIGEAIFQTPALWLLTACLGAAVTMVAGAYPALVLSRVRVVQAMQSSKSVSKGRLASLLVCAQFAAASFLLVTIAVMHVQNENIKRAAFSTMKDPIVVLSNDLATARVSFETLRTELSKQPHVKAVSASYVSLWGIGGAITAVSTSLESTATRRMVNQERVYYDFFETLEFELLAGRVFNRDNAEDIETGVVIDRALAQQNGWAAPQAAIGQMLYVWRPGAQQLPAEQYRVVGVVENKPTRLIGMGTTSNIFFLKPQMVRLPVIRLSNTDVAAGLREIDEVWERVAPSMAVKRRFADETLDNSLQIFQLVNNVFASVAALAMVIATLGLIGMSVHVIGRRTHEIGVRKTLGASVRQVLTMLLKDFSRPVIIANLIAWPLAYVAMQIYLSIFAHRAGLTFAPFALSFLVTLLIAWGAVAAQAARAARLKPANVLRYE